MDENPYHFAVVGEEDPDFAGGSYVFVQKYIHDMNAWNALPVEEQEKVIGRRSSMMWNCRMKKSLQMHIML